MNGMENGKSVQKQVDDLNSRLNNVEQAVIHIQAIQIELRHILESIRKIESAIDRAGERSEHEDIALRKRIENIEDLARNNRTWIKVVMWILGSAGIAAGGATGLLRLLG